MGDDIIITSTRGSVYHISRGCPNLRLVGISGADNKIIERNRCDSLG